MIKDLLINKTSEEIADIKGQEVAKIGAVGKINVKFSGSDYDIEIISTSAIKGGVEILARAWDLNGQIGFGDGTVDIERFRFINPPILVDDPNGDIIREWVDDDGNSKERKLRESPQEAILNSLAHTIKVKKEKFDSRNIIPDKIGSTTSTYYPNA